MALCVDRCPLTNHSGQMWDCRPVTQHWSNKLVFSSSELHVTHSSGRRRMGLYSHKNRKLRPNTCPFGQKINGVSIVFPRHVAFRALGTIEPSNEEVTMNEYIKTQRFMFQYSHICMTRWRKQRKQAAKNKTKTNMLFLEGRLRGQAHIVLLSHGNSPLLAGRQCLT